MRLLYRIVYIKNNKTNFTVKCPIELRYETWERYITEIFIWFSKTYQKTCHLHTGCVWIVQTQYSQCKRCHLWLATSTRLRRGRSLRNAAVLWLLSLGYKRQCLFKYGASLILSYYIVNKIDRCLIIVPIMPNSCLALIQ